MGSLKLGNVWVFVQLIHRPMRTKISCTKTQTLPNSRIADASGNHPSLLIRAEFRSEHSPSPGRMKARMTVTRTMRPMSTPRLSCIVHFSQSAVSLDVCLRQKKTRSRDGKLEVPWFRSNQSVTRSELTLARDRAPQRSCVTRSELTLGLEIERRNALGSRDLS